MRPRLKSILKRNYRNIMPEKIRWSAGVLDF